MALPDEVVVRAMPEPATYIDWEAAAPPLLHIDFNRALRRQFSLGDALSLRIDIDKNAP
ncbi:MAG: hypothetical protein CM15mP74_18770 [Halieaceae bacterium]|nr:MAG: hypothetical protein CM15mP74_18770 [Halieaceae bacterium]